MPWMRSSTTSSPRGWSSATPVTRRWRRSCRNGPAIAQIHALDAQLDDILAEGPEERYRRHADLARIAQDWARSRFALFAESGFESPTVTCVENTRGISVADLNAELGRQHVMLSNGYGKLKENTFRIGHMGDTQEWELRGLLATVDRILGIPG